MCSSMPKSLALESSHMHKEIYLTVTTIGTFCVAHIDVLLPVLQAGSFVISITTGLITIYSVYRKNRRDDSNNFR